MTSRQKLVLVFAVMTIPVIILNSFLFLHAERQLKNLNKINEESLVYRHGSSQAEKGPPPGPQAVEGRRSEAVAAIVRDIHDDIVHIGLLGALIALLAAWYLTRFVSGHMAGHARALEALNETNARLRTLVDAIPDLVYFKDTTGRQLFVNKACEEWLGCTKDDLHGKTEDYIPPDLAEACRLSDREVIETRAVVRTEERTSGPDGRLQVFETIKAPICDEEGNAVGLVGVSRPITERKEAEEALKESEAKFRALTDEFQALLDAIPDSISLQSPDYRFVWTNAVAAATLGRPAADLPGRHCYAMWQNRETLCDPCPVQRTFETGRPERALVTLPDGTIWEVRAVPIKDEEGKVSRVVELVRDVTETRRLEAQLRQSQKMEAVGRLAGGIAHDINNYLGAITGYCEHIRMTRRDDEGLVRRMEAVMETSFKASSLIKQLLAFSRKQPIRLEVVDLNAVVEGMGSMMQRLIGQDIALEMFLGEDLWSVKADVLQVEQVLMNLLVNARDAMPGGGKLTIETADVVLGDEYVEDHPMVRPGDYVMLAVSDTGTGMTPEVKESIFEPFFTTKEAGKGTGLGLATAYGIVKQHEGYIWVYSEIGKGSTFKIYLPRCEEEREAPPGPAADAPPPEAGIAGTGTILLVEDNEDVKEAIQSLLEVMGYNVIGAPNGDEALRVFGERNGDIELLITDVIMPGMSGREVAARIREKAPGIRVLYISGYTDNAVVSHGILAEGVNFLQKPFSAATLGRKVRDLLS